MLFKETVAFYCENCMKHINTQRRQILCRNVVLFEESVLRHYATSRKVAGSIPDEVVVFFNWPNPSSRTMTLWSTQPLSEMGTRNLPGGWWAAGA
jgi:hypothetical protein